MVNPIAAGASAVPLDAVRPEVSRPANLPEPAVQVTSAPEAHSSGSSTTSQRGDPAPLNADDPLDKTLETLNDNMKAWSTGMRFDVDAEAQRIVVSIIDSESGEVLRTVPSDAVIRVAKMIVQLQGRTVDTKA